MFNQDEATSCSERWKHSFAHGAVVEVPRARSWLVLIKLWQDWGLAGLPKNAHVWRKFIRPTELVAHLDGSGMEIRGMKGIVPRTPNPLSLLGGIRKVRAGTIRGAAVADLFEMKESSDLGMSYMGWALRR